MAYEELMDKSQPVNFKSTDALGSPSIPSSISDLKKDALEDDDGDLELQEKIEGLDPDKVDAIATMTTDEYSTYKGARFFQEKIWIRAHQNIKGVYGSDMDFGSGTSRAFVQVTRPKVQTMVGMVIPILLPNGNNAWTIDPSPRQRNRALVADMVANGASADEIKLALQKRAELAARNLTQKVETGFIEADLTTHLTRLINDAGSYGTGILAGPFAEETGEEVVTDEAQPDLYRPEVESVSPFDIYPDPGARTVEECRSIIRRKILNKRQLKDLQKKGEACGFITGAISEVLSNYSDGNWTPEWWESVINVTNSNYQMTAPNGRFVCLIRWGWVSGEDLIKAGFNGIDESMRDDQVMCQTWVVGHKVIAIKVSKLYRDRLPYYFVPFTVVPHSIWGTGIPEQMFDSQDATNSCERAKMDNLALSARPQVFVNTDRLVKGTNVLEQTAGKIWGFKESEISPNATPIQWYTPDCRIDVIQAVQNSSMQLADEQTSMPKLLSGFGGEGVHNRTSSGASLQFNAAITPLKTVVFNVENTLIKPLVSNMIAFYREFSEDADIRGDFKVFARGVQGLMARESLLGGLSQAIQFLGSIPGEADRLDYDQIGDMFVKCNELVDANIMLPDSIVQANRAKRAQDEQRAGQQDQQFAAKIKAETSPKDALIQAVQQSPDGGPLRLALLDAMLDAFGLKTPEVSKAMESEKAMQHIGAVSAAHEAGSNMAEREATPPQAFLVDQIQQQEAGGAE